MKKPGTNFSRYKNIAVLAFESNTPGAGQEVSDMVSMAFVQHGFNIVERTKLKDVLNENAVMMSGLTEDAKRELNILGIQAIVTGSVGMCQCTNVMVPLIVNGSVSGYLPANNCTVSFSFKMIDVSDASILWTISGSHNMQAMGMNPQKVLRKILDKMDSEFPNIE